MFLNIIFCYVSLADVVKLTEDTFNSFIKENPKALIKFFVPWCGHCKRLAPEFETASSKVHEGVILAEVNAEEEVELGKRFVYDSYPTVQWFDHGVATEYNGGFDSSEIVGWTNLMTMAVPVFEYDSILEAREAYPDNIVVVNTAKEGTTDFNYFNALAAENRLMAKFVRLSSEHQESEPHEIAMYRRGDSEPVKLSITDQSSNAVKKFLKIERVPLFGAITPETFEDYGGTGRGFIWVAGKSSDMVKYKDLFSNFAKTQRETYNVVFMDLDDSQRQADGMIGAEKYPVIALMKEEGPGRYILEEEHFTIEKLERWMEDISFGVIDPVLKSELDPISNEEPIKIVVGRQFNDIVVEDKDVLLMIEAPWCGHCKKVQPTYQKVAEKLTLLSPEIVVAKIDGTANEIGDRRFKFQSFPTIYWKKAGATPVKYAGDRSYNNFMTFVKANATKKFKWSLEDEFKFGDEGDADVKLDEL